VLKNFGTPEPGDGFRWPFPFPDSFVSSKVSVIEKQFEKVTMPQNNDNLGETWFHFCEGDIISP
jgi:hypothetical protein